ncbi:steroid 17-alpha-hydroxylase 17,20 lyase-like [Paramuricea clavata]|uniref:Steroid 17-alpha-hydroxylase 17,20 lyase-like n=1 Tax=Paramuricea clavata TaxID=317549 RepID=A0A6S7GSK0_PARCT|nr:steroid 17-alpha-hydroxylase 17,20 lyase-like [Paramuricea clavata]
MAIDLNPEYRLRRKAMNMALHIFGEGKKAPNENINDQLDEFFMAIEKPDGKPFYPPEIVERSIASHLWGWVTCKTDNISDGTADKLLDFNRTFFGLVPILKYFPTKHVLTVKYVKRRLHELFVTETIETRRPIKKGKKRDIMDSLLAFCIKFGLKTDCVSFLSADIILAGADIQPGHFLFGFCYT